MKKYLLLLILTAPAFCFSQIPNIKWQHTYGGSLSDEGSLVWPTSDKGFIVTGLSTSSDGIVVGHHGATDHWVVKLDSMGVVEWNQSFGGAGDDKGYNIVQTADGGYAFTGYATSEDGDLSGNYGFTDYWVVKLNSAGEILWQKNFGGSSAENSYGLIATLDNGLAVTGLSNTYDGSFDVPDNNGSFDYWVIKLDEDGNLEWQKSLGGTNTEQSFGIVQNADSSYVVCGYSSSPNTGMVTGNHGDNDYWIVKISKTGDLIWERSYGGSGSDRAFGISKTSDGGYIVNGVSPSTDGDVTGNHGDNDYWVIKLDGDGNLQWEGSYGGSGDDFGRIAFEMSGGGYMIGGRTNTADDGDVTHNHGNYDYWVAKLDSAGNLLSERCFGGTKNEGAPPALVPFMNVIELYPNNYIMAGCSFSVDGDVQGNFPVDSLDDNYWVVRFGEDEEPPPPPLTIEDDLLENILLFPDPVQSLLELVIPGQTTEIYVSLYRLDGSLAISNNYHNTSHIQLSVDVLDKGFYLLKITDSKGNSTLRKIVKI